MIVQVGHDIGLLPIRDDKLFVNDHLHEARLVRESLQGSLQLIREVILHSTNNQVSGEMSYSTNLSFLVVGKTHRVKVFQNLFSRIIFLDLALEVEADHVARINLRRQLEELKETLLLCLLQVLRAHGDSEVDIQIVVVLFVILQKGEKLE